MNTQPHNAENGETQSNWEIETDKIKKEALKIIDSFDDFYKKHLPVEDHNWQDGYINGYIVGKRSGLCIPYSNYTQSQVLSMLEALRQRCSEEAGSGRPIGNPKQSILSIDLTQFLQK